MELINIISETKRNIVQGTLLGFTIIMIFSSCTLSDAKSNNTHIIEEPEFIRPENKEQNSVIKSVILTEKNGVVLTTPQTEENNLLREITVDMRGEIKNTFLWEAELDTSRPPRIEEVDVNADGIKEIIIHMNAGTGTGIAINDIHVLNPNTLEELIVEDPVLRLNSDLNSTVKHRLGKTYIDAELNGKHLSRVYDYEGGSWGEQVGFGSIVYYEVVDGHLRASLAGQASMSEFPLKVMVDYGSNLNIVNSTLFYSAFLQPPLSEEDVKFMLEQWLPEGDWVFDHEDDQYSAIYSTESGNSKSMMMNINPMTGTVYDTSSGSPLKSLANVEAPDLFKITSDLEYKAELYKLAESILEAAGLKPTSKEWISGFLSDGYLWGEVKRSDQKFMIKVDVFTGQWEQIKDPLK